MNNMSDTKHQMISLSEVAELAGVRPSAVSNWRRRHHDFPAPRSADVGERYLRTEVQAWLELHGKWQGATGTSLSSTLWAVLSAMPVDTWEAATLLLQALVLRTRVARASASREPHFVGWDELRDAYGFAVREQWARVTESICSNDPSLQRALSLSTALPDEAIKKALVGVDGLQARVDDLGAQVTSFLRRLQVDASASMPYRGTPRGLSELLLALLSPLSGTVMDPAAGMALVLADAARTADSSGVTRLLGQEIHEATWKLAYLNLSLQDVPFDLQSGDTLLYDSFRGTLADRVVLEPPFHVRFESSQSASDPRWRFGVSREGDWMWAQHLLAHLGENARGVMLTSTGALFRSGADQQIRAGILHVDLLDAVIELPPGLIPGIAISSVILMFDRNRQGSDRQGRVLFIDARTLGTNRRGQLNELAAGDIARISDAVTAWRSGHSADESHFLAVVNVADVLKEKADLRPHRYIRYPTVSDSNQQLNSLQVVEREATLAVEALRDVTRFSSQLVETTRSLRRTAEQPSLVRLKDLLVTEPVTGIRKDPEGELLPMPWVATGLVSGGTAEIDAVPMELTRGRPKDRVAIRDDLLLTARGLNQATRVGCAVVRVDQPLAFSESLMRLRVNPARILPDYLRLVLTSAPGHRALAAATTGTTIGNLRADVLQEIELRVPSIEVQRRLVEEIVVLERHQTKLNEGLRHAHDYLAGLRDGVADGQLQLVAFSSLNTQ
jgi:hypothetical protein